VIWLVQSECKPPGYIYSTHTRPVLMQGLPKGYAHIVVQVTNSRKNMATLHAITRGGGVSLARPHTSIFLGSLSLII
jgi:hypothetical protein